MVRIKDIASQIGVSATTVSNVIHGKDKHVSAATKEKIQKAVKEMGYVPSMSALMLAKERSGMIGVVLENKRYADIVTLEDPYYSALVGHLDKKIRERGYCMLIIADQSEAEIIHQARAWNLEGLIVCNMEEKKLLSLHAHYEGPMISVDSYLNSQAHLINIMTDDFGGGYQMGKYLISKGHRKLTMVADNDYGVDHYRWLGFKKALIEAGIEVTSDHHRLISVNDEERLRSYERDLTFYRERTALFFASDFYALEACSFFQNLGIAVPTQLSIAGFDDLIYARLSQPRLTTIHQSIDRKATMALEALQTLLNREETHNKWLLSVTLVERNSTGECI